MLGEVSGHISGVSQHELYTGSWSLPLAMQAQDRVALTVAVGALATSICLTNPSSRSGSR